MGEQSSSLHRHNAIKKGGPSWGGQDRHHLAQVDHVQGKGLPLIGFLFYRSHGSCGRPGYRIVCRTIKGGSQVGSLIVSLVESSNHCILASYFLVLVWFFSLWDLELMVIFMTSSSSSKTEFSCIFYDVFDVGGYAGSSLLEVSLLCLLSIPPLSLFWCYSLSCFKQAWVCSIRSSFAEVVGVLILLDQFVVFSCVLKASKC